MPRQLAYAELHVDVATLLLVPELRLARVHPGWVCLCKLQLYLDCSVDLPNESRKWEVEI